MPLNRRAFLGGTLTAGALLFLGRQASAADIYRARWYLFGTLVDVEIVENDRAKAQRVLADLTTLLRGAHTQWHAWKPGELNDLNQALAQGESFVVDDPHLLKLIHGVRELHASSGGLFNPAIGRVVRLWGFHDDELPKGQPPATQQIERLMADAPSPAALRVEGRRVSSDNRSVQLDLGGYAKGYALGLATDFLKQQGIENAIVNAGGDLSAIGRHPSRAWRIGVRDPQRRGSVASIETHGHEAIMTSGNYERYRLHRGKRFAHIIDPRTGLPADQLASVTVIHADAGLADAAATAISVAGEGRWPEVAAAFGVDQAMVIDNSGRLQLTRPMAERLSLSQALRRQAAVVA